MNYTPEEIEAIRQGVRKDFPQRIRNLREAAGLSQDAFAKALGVSRAAIGYYENGERLPDISFLATVYERTGCNLKYLLGYADTMVNYEYKNYALNYDLTDAHMQNLESLLECSIFKEILSKKEFVEFFEELERYEWDFPHDDQTRVIVEYLCVATLGRMVGKAFVENKPWLINNEELEKSKQTSRDKVVDHINEVRGNRKKYTLTKKQAAMLERIKKENEDDPFSNLKLSLRILRKKEENAET